MFNPRKIITGLQDALRIPPAASEKSTQEHLVRDENLEHMPEPAACEDETSALGAPK